MDKYALPSTNKKKTRNKGYTVKYNIHLTSILQLETDEENVEKLKEFLKATF